MSDWARDLRRLVIEISLRAGVGHVGSALGICDIVAVLFGSILRGVGSSDPDRDRFILSKGHAALALYAALHRGGLVSRAELETFCADGSRLGAHPEHGVPGIEVSTGSLGMGLSIGAGLALSFARRKSRARVFVLLSDAELDEGSVWEAVMFAAHHRLANLVAVVDLNGMQALGRTRDILDLEPVEARFSAFGWDAVAISGHDEAALEAALKAESPRPRAIVARTVMGKGASFLEGKLEAHYYPIDARQAEQALREVEGSP
jgi:transketolase